MICFCVLAMSLFPYFQIKKKKKYIYICYGAEKVNIPLVSFASSYQFRLQNIYRQGKGQDLTSDNVNRNGALLFEKTVLKYVLYE